MNSGLFSDGVAAATTFGCLVVAIYTYIKVSDADKEVWR